MICKGYHLSLGGRPPNTVGERDCKTNKSIVVTFQNKWLLCSGPGVDGWWVGFMFRLQYFVVCMSCRLTSISTISMKVQGCSY